jgi:hypothetical protein
MHRIVITRQNSPNTSAGIPFYSQSARRFLLRRAFFSDQTPSKDLVILTGDIAHRFHCLGHDAPFGAQDAFHRGYDSHGVVDTTQPQRNIMDATTLFEVFDGPGGLFAFRRAVRKFHRLPISRGFNRSQHHLGLLLRPVI